MTGRCVLALALLSAVHASAQSRTVALTFDDLPGNSEDAAEIKSINASLLSALDRYHAPATAFVIGNIAHLTSESWPAVEEWKRRGYSIGNHTWSHRDFSTLTVEQEEDEILQGERVIAPFLSPEMKYLRFPNNSTGETPEKHAAILAFLKQHHYQVATCTIDNEDYVFAAAYQKILDKHDEAAAAKLKQDYLAYTATEIDYYSQLHKQVFGHEIPHVMLLHASRLNADTIDQVLKLFTDRGYRFVTLSQAQSDSAYATPDTYVTKYGPMWGYRWAKELGVHVDGRLETEPPAWIGQYGN